MIQSPNRIRLFLCGDVMTGRGIDQIMPRPVAPQIYEAWVHSASGYVDLAESAHGAIPRSVGPGYIWGEALHELDCAKPDVLIANLETSITRSEDYLPKGINYRMSPENAECLRVLDLDCCVLANNHVLDWGKSGLLDTLTTLKGLDIRVAGAGHDLTEAQSPAIFERGASGRVLVFAMACADSGIPSDWAATATKPGINLVSDLADGAVKLIAREAKRIRRDGDIIVVSIHWGANWGYDVPASHREFAHALIDEAGVSVVHGHSSHHPKPIEVYKSRLILYGCGDFINDYEGIKGYESFRDDLVLIYLADFEPGSGHLAALEMVPFQIKRFQLTRASAEDSHWLADVLNRESFPFRCQILNSDDARLSLSLSD